MIKRLLLLSLFLAALFAYNRFSASDGESTSENSNSSSENSPDIQFSGGMRPLENFANLDPKKSALGRELFQEKKLSVNNTISCRDCHNLDRGGSDDRAFSVGINGRVGTANTPTVFNSAFNFKQFWDGRAENLNDQIEGPIHNTVEMGSTWEDIVAKLKQDPHYASQFQSIYKSPPTPEHIKDALVEFEKTLVTLNAPFDKYLRGQADALTESQISGYKKFSSFGCISCHQGQNIGGNMFQTLGITGDYFKDRGGSYPSDLGRYNITKVDSDKHVFKVPSLRNVALTAPYFHDGSAKNLQDAIRIMAKYQLGRHLTDQDVSDINAFLESLTGETPASLTNPPRGVANEK